MLRPADTLTAQMVRTSVHQFFKGERRLPPMRTETATTGNRQAANVRHWRANLSCSFLCSDMISK